MPSSFRIAETDPEPARFSVADTLVELVVWPRGVLPMDPDAVRAPCGTWWRVRFPLLPGA